MGIGVSRWEGSNFSEAIQRLPDVFYQRTGLGLQVEGPGRSLGGSTSYWSLNVLELQKKAFVEFYLKDNDQLPHQRIVGEWIAPEHPYLWYQIQASLFHLGFRSARVNPKWALPEQTVPRRWNRRWSELSFLRRAVYGRPDLWPLWFF